MAGQESTQTTSDKETLEGILNIIDMQKEGESFEFDYKGKRYSFSYWPRYASGVRLPQYVLHETTPKETKPQA